MAAYEITEIRKFKAFPGTYWPSTRFYDADLNLLLHVDAKAAFLAGELLTIENLSTKVIGRIVYAPISGEMPKASKY